ncbi:MAG: rhodanese-like domain-containing protein [Pseudomonadota bacterium]
MSRILAALIALVLALPLQAEQLKPLSEPSDMLPEGVLIIDIRSSEDFRVGHIPGAVNAPYAQWRGPKENPGRVPSVTKLQALLQGLGAMMGQGILVVHEGRNATDFGSAARVYWTLKSAGFTDLSILNGGYAAWVREGGNPETVAEAPTPSDVEIAFAGDWMIDAAGVKDVVTGASEAVLLDARPLDFFEGKKKHGAAAEAGTLAGAFNIVHSTWFAGGSPMMEAPAAMITEIRAVAGENAEKPLVSFCNTGHWAATNWFVASEIAGIENVKLYPESMVGWTLLGNAVTNGG